MKGLLLAIQFLTIVPVRIRGMVTETEVGESGTFFPLVGAAQGLVAALAALLLFPLFPEQLVSGLLVFLLIATNGGFHLDGVADTFDGVAVKSTGNVAADREKRLAVMKDSSTGAIGVTAVVLGILLKYLFISALFQRFSATSAAYLIFLMPLFSKWTIIPVMFHGGPARNDGLGKIFIDGTGKGVVVASSIMLMVIYFAALWIPGSSDVMPGMLFLAAACLFLYAFSLFWTLFCDRKFGGLTGDTIGASGEIADLLFLATALLWF